MRLGWFRLSQRLLRIVVEAGDGGGVHLTVFVYVIDVVELGCSIRRTVGAILLLEQPFLQLLNRSTSHDKLKMALIRLILLLHGEDSPLQLAILLIQVLAVRVRLLQLRLQQVQLRVFVVCLPEFVL